MSKKAYMTPAILRRLPIAPQQSLLSGSIFDDLNVSTSGQEVKPYDFNDGDTFNHNWQ